MCCCWGKFKRFVCSERNHCIIIIILRGCFIGALFAYTIFTIVKTISCIYLERLDKYDNSSNYTWQLNFCFSTCPSYGVNKVLNILFTIYIILHIIGDIVFSLRNNCSIKRCIKKYESTNCNFMIRTTRLLLYVILAIGFMLYMILVIGIMLAGLLILLAGIVILVIVLLTSINPISALVEDTICETLKHLVPMILVVYFTWFIFNVRTMLCSLYNIIESTKDKPKDQDVENSETNSQSNMDCKRRRQNESASGQNMAETTRLLENETDCGVTGTDQHSACNQDDFQVQDPENNSALHTTVSDQRLSTGQVNYMLKELAPSVCKITIPGRQATGFVVGGLLDRSTQKMHRFILTCFHVGLRKAFQMNKKCMAEFEGNSSAVFWVPIEPVAIYCDKDLDYMLVRLEYCEALESVLNNVNPLGKIIALRKPTRKDPLVIIGYPSPIKQHDFGVYSVSLTSLDGIDAVNIVREHTFGKNKVYALTNKHTFYHCRSLQGASGAPCFSVPLEHLYSMHLGAVYKSNEREYGIMLVEVLQHIADQIKQEQSSTPNPMKPVLYMDEFYKLFPTFPSQMATS